MDPDRARWEARYRKDAARHAASPPSAFLVSAADRIRGRVLDVAAGAGRNALYLAARGCRVEALDIAHGGLRVALDHARRAGWPLAAVQADLATYPLPTARYDAVINIRFLLRPLFPRLVRALVPGGIILVETFLEQQRGSGHPRNPDFLLRPGELPGLIPGCDVEQYAEGEFADGEQTAHLARFLGRRRRD